MSGALLCLAAALLTWPVGSRSRERLAVPGRWTTGRLPRAWLTAPVPVGCAAGAIAALASTPLVAVLAGGCAALGARGLRLRRRAATEAGRGLALAEALAVLAAELRAGRSTAAAVAAAVAACPDERTGRALSVLLPAAVAGSSPAESDDPDLVRVGAAVALSVRTGCSLAAVLTAVEDDLRARDRHRAELRTATAGPRASAMVLAGLPVLGLAMGSGVGADPWRVLTTTGAGQVLLVLGVALEIAGVAWVGRLTRRAAPELVAGSRRRAR